MKTQMLALRKEGKSYREIADELHCSKGLVSYHLSDGQKQKTLDRQRTFRKKNPLAKKLQKFRARKPNRIGPPPKAENVPKAQYMKVVNYLRREGNKFTKKLRRTFSFEEFQRKQGPEPRCYLSGRLIDWNATETYHIDHRVPVSKGGTNEWENAELICAEANLMKSNLTEEEMFDLMIEILVYRNQHDRMRKALMN